MEFDVDLMIPDQKLSIAEGAIQVFGWQSSTDKKSYTRAILDALAREYHFDLETPFKDYPQEVKEKGGRAVKLAVSGAFHTPYMKDASEELEKALKTMTINAPQTEIYANRTGKPYPQDIAQIIETIALQASSSVRFEDTLKNMWADGIDTFIEVGAGKTLTGFVKKTLPEAKMYTVTTVDALNEAIENIKAGE